MDSRVLDLNNPQLINHEDLLQHDMDSSSGEGSDTESRSSSPDGEHGRRHKYGDINLDEHPYSSSYVGMSAAANSVQQLSLREQSKEILAEESQNKPHRSMFCLFLARRNEADNTQSKSKRSSQQYKAMLISLCIVQFLIWFKPSEQYLFNVVPGWFNITTGQLLRNVYAHSLYAPFLLFPGVAVVFDKLGYKWAISVCVGASFATVALVIFGAPLTGLLYLSEWTWALHFSAMFVVVATLYSLFPISWYMTIASANSGSMLMASLTSSLTGFVVSKVGSSCTADKSQMGDTFYVTLAFSSAGLLFWIYLLLSNILLSRKRKIPVPGKLMKWLIKRKSLWFWLFPAILVRGTHTLVIEVWPALSKASFPQACLQAYNGLIGFSMQLFAVASVATLVYVAPRLRNWYTFVPAGLAGSASGALLILSIFVGNTQQSDTDGATGKLLFFGGMLTVYNACSEALLAYCSAQAASDITLGASSRSFVSKFCIVLSIRAASTQLWQLIVQFTLWPHGVWPLKANPYGMELSLSRQFIGFAIFTGIAALVSISLALLKWPSTQLYDNLDKRRRKQLLQNSNVAVLAPELFQQESNQV